MDLDEGRTEGFRIRRQINEVQPLHLGGAHLLQQAVALITMLVGDDHLVGLKERPSVFINGSCGLQRQADVDPRCVIGDADDSTSQAPPVDLRIAGLPGGQGDQTLSYCLDWGWR